MGFNRSETRSVRNRLRDTSVVAVSALAVLGCESLAKVDGIDNPNSPQICSYDEDFLHKRLLIDHVHPRVRLTEVKIRKNDIIYSNYIFDPGESTVYRWGNFIDSSPAGEKLTDPSLALKSIYELNMSYPSGLPNVPESGIWEFKCKPLSRKISLEEYFTPPRGVIFLENRRNIFQKTKE